MVLDVSSVEQHGGGAVQIVTVVRAARACPPLDGGAVKDPLSEQVGLVLGPVLALACEEPASAAELVRIVILRNDGHQRLERIGDATTHQLACLSAYVGCRADHLVEICLQPHLRDGDNHDFKIAILRLVGQDHAHRLLEQVRRNLQSGEGVRDLFWDSL